MFTIEKNFHNIWVTRDNRGKALPEAAVYNVRHNMAIGRDWRHIIWTNSPKKIYDGLLKILPSIPKNLYIQHTSELSNIISQLKFNEFFTESASGRNPNFAQIVDVMKFMILYEYGGIVVDCPDTYSFATKNFGDLICDYGVLFYGSVETDAGHEIMAASKGNQILIDYLYFMKRRIREFKSKKSRMGKFKTPTPARTENLELRRSVSSLTSIGSNESYFDRATDYAHERLDDFFNDDDDWGAFADRSGLDDFDEVEAPEYSLPDDSRDSGYREDFSIFDDYEPTTSPDTSPSGPPDHSQITAYDEYRVTNSRREETINLTGPTAINIFLDEFLNDPHNAGKFIKDKFYFELAHVSADEEVVSSPYQVSRLMIGIKMMGERFGQSSYVKFGKLQGGAAGSWNQMKFYSSDDSDITRF